MDQILDTQIDRLSNERALATPLPGPLEEAFCCEEMVVAGKTIRKCTPSIMVALQRIKSPVMEQIYSTVTGQDASLDKVADEDVWDVLWIFTHSPGEVRKAVESKQVRELAMQEIGDDWDAGLITLVMAGVMEQFKRAFFTCIKYGAEEKEKGKLTFFRDSGMSQPTASVG